MKKEAVEFTKSVYELLKNKELDSTEEVFVEHDLLKILKAYKDDDEKKLLELVKGLGELDKKILTKHNIDCDKVI